jgi:predicted kinase
VRRPLLVVVAGPPGSGKTTLSRAVGDALALPVVCRDAVKEGLAATTGTVVDGAEARSEAFAVFYEIVALHLARGVSAIAEAAFRADLAPTDLARFAAVADLVLVRCDAPEDVWFGRFQARGERPGHADAAFVARTLAAGGPDGSVYRLELEGVPTVVVDTTDGYQPQLADVMDRIRSAHSTAPTTDMSRTSSS